MSIISFLKIVFSTWECFNMTVVVYHSCLLYWAFCRLASTIQLAGGFLQLQIGISDIFNLVVFLFRIFENGLLLGKHLYFQKLFTNICLRIFREGWVLIYDVSRLFLLFFSFLQGWMLTYNHNNSFVVLLGMAVGGMAAWNTSWMAEMELNLLFTDFVIFLSIPCGWLLSQCT